MIQMNTILKVSDNSGARVVRCIKILLGAKQFFGSAGDLLVTSVLRRVFQKRVERREIRKVVIIRTKQKIRRINGISVKFDYNSAVIVNMTGLPIASRIFGPVTYELRRKNYLKILSLSSKVI